MNVFMYDEGFELTLSPDISNGDIKGDSKSKWKNDTNKAPKTPSKNVKKRVAKVKRCPYTLDMVEQEFGVIYVKSKGEY